MGFNLRRGVLAGLALMLISGCSWFNQSKEPEEVFYKESLVRNTVSYDVSLKAEEYLKAIETLYLHEHPDFKNGNSGRLPDPMRVAIRAEADKMGKRDRRISETEAKAFYDKVVRNYELNLELPDFGYSRFEQK